MSRPQIALLKFGDRPLLPTKLLRTGSFTVGKPIEDRFFRLTTDEDVVEGRASVKNTYLQFKDSLRLTAAQAKDEERAREWQEKNDLEVEGWSMSRENSRQEAIRQDDKTYEFSPYHAAKYFLTMVCREAVKRAQSYFGKDQDIRIHFTAPNYEFEGGDEELGKQLSRNYRDNVRSIIEEQMTGRRLFENVEFEVGGRDFLYEPYGVYYYYSLIEHSIDLGEDATGKTYLVFDMGGSTTDLAIVQVNKRGTSFQLYPISRSIRQAGEYFDRWILKDFLGRSQVPPRGSDKWAQAQQEIERAKINICTGKSTSETVRFRADGEQHEYELDADRIRRLLTDWWNDDNQDLGPGFRGFLSRVQQRAKDHGQFLEFDTIERVFLAGGSTGLPGLKKLIRQDLKGVGIPLESDRELFVDDSETCVRPRRRLFSGEALPNSALASLGRTANLVDVSHAFSLDEGEIIYAKIVDGNGKPYTFHRGDVTDGNASDEEFAVCTVAELAETSSLLIHPDEETSFKYHRLDDGSDVPSRFAMRLRADVNEYSEDAQFHFAGEISSNDGADTFLQLSVRSQLDGTVQVEPDLFSKRQGRDREKIDRSPNSPASVPLHRIYDDGDVHITIDFGMNNTVVSMHAPGRPFPEEVNDLEVINLYQSEPTLDAVVRGGFVWEEELSLEETVRHIVKIHREVGYREEYAGVYHLLRGAAALSHLRRRDSGDVFDAGQASLPEVDRFLDTTSAEDLKPLLNHLREKGATNLTSEQLLREASSALRLLHTGKSPAGIAKDICALASSKPNLTLDDVLQRFKAETSSAGDVSDLNPANDASPQTDLEEKPEPSSVADEAPGEPPPDQSGETGTPQTSPSDEDTSDSQQTEEEPSQTDTDMPQDGKSTRSDPPVSPSDGHWAVGMTQWMEGIAQQFTRPLQESNKQTEEALRSLVCEVKSVKDQLEEPDETGVPEALMDTLSKINDHLKTIADQVGDDEASSDTSSSGDPVESRILDQVEDEESALSRLDPGNEHSFQNFCDFVDERGFIYPEKALRDVWTHVTSGANSLAVLAGPPGCGKTSLVRLVAQFFHRDLEAPDGDFDGWTAYHRLEPVSPSWFSPDGLLGSVSVIDDTYQYTEFLKFLKKAEAHYQMAATGAGSDRARLFFACLDEFNIAQPEQYLADLLSKLEADVGGRRLERGQQSTSGRSSTVEVELYPNLRLFGTINTDATTKTLSPKVLDRSLYISMSPSKEDLKEAMSMYCDQFEVDGNFHAEMEWLLPELYDLMSSGQTPLAFRSIKSAYQYAANHPRAGEEHEIVVGDVLVSYFLSKLPGVFAINDPKQDYQSKLEEAERLPKYPGAAALLERIQRGLPGQAAL